MENKVAVITGASRGIGKAIAVALAREKMNVVVNYSCSKDQANSVVSRINEFSKAIAIKADVSKSEEVLRMKDEVLEIFGRVDVIVNNAGAILRPADWQTVTDNIWNKTIDINLKGVFNCIRFFAPILLNQKHGKIINITSTYGILGAAPVVAYTAAKAGVINLTRSFAKELAPHVNVNAIAPGNIDTSMTRRAGDEFIDSVIADTPLKRLGLPEDIANTASFLASSKSDFITGQIISVDGGHSLR